MATKPIALKWHTEKRKVSEIIPYELNPRRISEKKRRDLELSLIKFNLVEIPVIDLDNKLIAGHQRLSLLILLGRAQESIDVRVPNRKLSEDEFKEYNIRSNRQAGTFDTRVLENAFSTDELIRWGFTPGELAKPTDALIDGRAINRNRKTGYSYKLQFKSQEQLEAFSQFVEVLKSQYPEVKFTSHRILRFFSEKGT